jgi:hypothetical protein
MTILMSEIVPFGGPHPHWVYGHTHECDDQTISQIRIISNQLGHPGNSGAFECQNFDEPVPIDVSV